jgi:hypothetical protein
MIQIDRTRPPVATTRARPSSCAARPFSVDPARPARSFPERRRPPPGLHSIERILH